MARPIRVELRLDAAEHERLTARAAQDGKSTHAILKEELQPVLRGDFSPTMRLKLYLTRLILDDLAAQEHELLHDIARIDAQIHRLEPGHLFRPFIQETRDITSDRLHRLRLKIEHHRTELKTLTTLPALLIALPPLNSPAILAAAIILILGAGALYINRRKPDWRAASARKYREWFPEKPKDLTKEERAAIVIPGERDPRGRGLDEPEDYASAEEYARLHDYDARFLGARIDRFLDQEDSEQRIREFCEDHDFLAVNTKRELETLHLRAFTDDQLKRLPGDLRNEIESARLRRAGTRDAPPAALTPGLTTAAGPSTNGHAKPKPPIIRQRDTIPQREKEKIVQRQVVKRTDAPPDEPAAPDAPDALRNPEGEE